MSESNKKDVFQKILQNYSHMNKMMVEELELASSHGGVTGHYREAMWMKFFRSMIPKKYSLAQGVILIDSNRNVSKEVDIAVYDEAYTPYVYQYNTLKFIPIEAVAVVIECKSKSYDLSQLKAWADEINNLTPKASGIARMATGYVSGLTNDYQAKTSPIKIFVCLKSVKEERTIDDTAEQLNAFDFIIQQHEEQFDLRTNNERQTLDWWGRKLNGTLDKEDQRTGKEREGLKLYNRTDDEQKIKSRAPSFPELTIDETTLLQNTLADLKVEGYPLLTLNLQLNQLLMLINNPMLFPHFAYARAFNKKV
ncbi:hypothetical protein SK3146_04720 [Paenibacillus konkukensis]|uniref:DUF6602 domain-containing protein n=1 Tax=Paenibacillus konkukensis TaxID=2020716 RepID=A0ABY4RS81_9BACL|nr:DUF6602 domain-containing protein [Paenibacillus konkukensis]UQZ85431.1 hypothetical protein SK3146_04720 [Paenibacillus konkukensis]